jgi:hypothetical protein
LSSTLSVLVPVPVPVPISVPALDRLFHAPRPCLDFVKIIDKVDDLVHLDKVQILFLFLFQDGQGHRFSRWTRSPFFKMDKVTVFQDGQGPDGE